jgi:hypothetical protein
MAHMPYRDASAGLMDLAAERGVLLVALELGSPNGAGER